MPNLHAVLDGSPHTGAIRDLSPDDYEVTVDGVTYRDTGHLHAHEQHDWVRWFLRADLPAPE